MAKQQLTAKQKAKAVDDLLVCGPGGRWCYQWHIPERSDTSGIWVDYFPKERVEFTAVCGRRAVWLPGLTYDTRGRDCPDCLARRRAL